MNNEEKTISLEAIAEQWVNLVFAHTEVKKRKNNNTIVDEEEKSHELKGK